MLLVERACATKDRSHCLIFLMFIMSLVDMLNSRSKRHFHFSYNYYLNLTKFFPVQLGKIQQFFFLVSALVQFFFSVLNPPITAIIWIVKLPIKNSYVTTKVSTRKVKSKKGWERCIFKCIEKMGAQLTNLICIVLVSLFLLSCSRHILH